MRLIIASRKSDLARLQALTVGQALKTAHPDLEIVYQFRESLGDKNLNDPLWQMPEKGVFTQDFYEDLVHHRTDLVVHSWKDLPVESRPGTEIAVTLARADMRDVLLVRKDRWETAKKTGRMTVFSSSPRRAYNIHPFLLSALPAKISALNFEPVRGNVPTRVEKLFDRDVDGLVVAKAALDRLLEAPGEEFRGVQDVLRRRLSECHLMVLPLRKNPTAAAQGALAVEVASDREDVKKLLAKVHDDRAFRDVLQERRILAGYGGGCHQKVGVSVLTRDYGQIIFVRAFTDKGEKVERVELIPSTKPQPKTEISKIFPENPGAMGFFKRESLPSGGMPEGPLWISKAEALPPQWCPGPESLIWVSGLETWKKLAARGVWVHGSAESLGEEEDSRMETLFGRVEWTKLTHLWASENQSDPIKSLATYKLTPESAAPDLSGKTHFYWSSGTAFLRALELCPAVRNGFHGCGPGHTKAIIEKTLGTGARVNVFLSYEEWKRQVTL